MLYNGRLFLHFLLLAVALISTFQGAVVLKIRYYEVPFGSYRELHGRSAVGAGVALIVIGVLSALSLVALLAG